MTNEAILAKTEKREQALTQAVARYGKQLLSAMTERLRNQGEAEEVVQEVFTDFLEAYDIDQAIDSLGGWLFTVARNKVLDRFRRRKNETQFVDTVLSEEPESLALNGPEAEMTSKYLREEISAALELLPEDQREVFIQHELDGKSFQQMSEETGLSVNTLLSKKRYALIFLRDHLKEVYDELE